VVPANGAAASLDNLLKLQRNGKVVLRHFSQAMRGGGKKAAAKTQDAAPAKTA